MRKTRKIEVRGDVAIIPLTRGHSAIIDAVDVDLVRKINWWASSSKSTSYARGSKQRRWRMPLWILQDLQERKGSMEFQSRV